MAASQLVCSIFGVAFERLYSLIHKDELELSSLVGMKKELKKLYKAFCKIKDVLNDAEERQLKEEAVLFWLQELNDAAYEAGDVFDEIEYEALQQLASDGASSSNNNLTEFFYGKVGKLIDDFHEIAEDCSSLDLQKGKEMSMVVSSDRKTISLLTEPQVYGRDEDREKMVKQLLGSAYLALPQFHSRNKHPNGGSGKHVLNNVSSSNQDNISVVSILGMGGLGKTTLAKLVYNDERVQNYFKDRSWVCVSDDFDIERIIKAIVTSISGSKCDLDDFELLQRRLQSEVHGKRFLLVLDDVWEERREEWNKLMAVFRGAAQGSWIVVTTRLQNVASITSKLHPHCLDGLSNEHCWALFKQYAFGPGNEEKPTLVEIGKKIVKKCGGLPLAAKALGGLLRYKNEDNEWEAIDNSEIWKQPQSNEKNGVLPALRLSYYHLPSHMKPCFVYCSIHPKDCGILKEEIIQLWMANGLVPSHARMELEDAGNEIFNTLVQMSFFQVGGENMYGDAVYKMHDLVHDFASYIAGDEYFVENFGNERNITNKRTRHVSLLFQRGVLPPSIFELIKERDSSQCLHSLIKLNVIKTTSIPEFVFSKFIRLRALDLNSCSIKVVPNSIGGMIHLRYLNLSFNPFTSLPDSICLLKNVQTLKLKGCEELESLPKDMGKMSSLRHLNIDECDDLTSMPVAMGQLTCLKTLSSFIVGMESGCGVNELRGLNNLGGKLAITRLEHVKNAMDAKEANLMEKKNIRWVQLIWSHSNSELEEQQDREEESMIRLEGVMDGLQPHSNVRKLFVDGYRGVTLSTSWLKPSLVPNLVEISLFECRRCERLPPLGKFHHLKILNLGQMDPLKFIQVDDDTSEGGGGFPSLECLLLEDMPNLERWSSLQSQAAAAITQEIAVFPRLKRVSLYSCPKLKVGVLLSGSPQVQYVEIRRCNAMLVGSLRDLPCLNSLLIADLVYDDELEYFPRGSLRNLTALQTLRIYSCSNIKALPLALNSLTKLTELRIDTCRDLVSLVEEEEGGEEGEEGGLGNLTSLQTLHICSCAALKRLPLINKTSLLDFKICHCPEMKFSKEDFEHLVVLERLQLLDLPKLTCFPEGIKHASLLHILEIRDCSEDGAVDLPDWIGTDLTSLQVLIITSPRNWKVLPQWMQYLTALQELLIWECDEELVARWKNRDELREKEDYCFNMISHVPDVEIASERWDPIASMYQSFF